MSTSNNLEILDSSDEEEDLTIKEESVKKRKLTSIVWEEFDKLPLVEGGDGKVKAKCKRCDKTYCADSTYGTKNMLRHIKKCPKKMDNDIQQMHISYGLKLAAKRIDQEVYREKVTIATVKHNYPFTWVEHEANRDIHSYLNPDVKPITRNTLRADVCKLYRREKEKLKKIMNSIPSRICLTSDLWTSSTTEGYICLTAHFVDENWKLQSKILNFCHMPPPHNGIALADTILKFLKEWGIEKKIFSITLDNASSNDSMQGILKQQLNLGGFLLLKGVYFHIRCAAHILHLIVQEGLKVIDEAAFKVRESVKYVKGSESRRVKFQDCVKQVGEKSSKGLRLDVCTRWNSTYQMLENAMIYQRAFTLLQMVDVNYKHCPSNDDWIRVETITKFLKPFSEISNLFSGTNYPTANLYFDGVWKIQLRLLEEISSPDKFIRDMAVDMKEKFDKYWVESSMVLSLAVVLDPRYKLDILEFCLKKINMYTYEKRVKLVKDQLYYLFMEYDRIALATASDTTCLRSKSSGSGGGNHDEDEDEGFEDDTKEFDYFEGSHSAMNKKNELDLYLDEIRLKRAQYPDFDVLKYWNDESKWFPVLSLMARDLLSIPITTVASESSFSRGGRILNKYRYSLLPENVQTLICTQNWLNVCEDENHDDMERQLEVQFSNGKEKSIKLD